MEAKRLEGVFVRESQMASCSEMFVSWCRIKDCPGDRELWVTSSEFSAMMHADSECSRVGHLFAEELYMKRLAELFGERVVNELADGVYTRVMIRRNKWVHDFDDGRSAWVGQ